MSLLPFTKALAICIVMSGVSNIPLLATEATPLQPLRLARLSDILPPGVKVQISGTAVSQAGVFLLCHTLLPNPKGQTGMIIRMDAAALHMRVIASGFRTPSTAIAADDAGNVAILTLNAPEDRMVKLFDMEGNLKATDVAGNVMRLAALDGRFYGFSETGVRPLFAEGSAAREIPFSVPQPLFNQRIVPLSQNRFALVTLGHASISIVDVASGAVSPPERIQSQEIRTRFAGPIEPGLHSGVTNAIKSVTSDLDGGLLVSPTGHYISESIVIEVDEWAKVSRTLRFTAAAWDELKSPQNPGGYMQGHELVKSANYYLWFNGNLGMIAIYEPK